MDLNSFTGHSPCENGYGTQLRTSVYLKNNKNINSK
jgi:hypothetical protein